MPRRPRIAMGGVVYHVINRGVGRMTLFENDNDYAAFERTLAESVEKLPAARLLGYCLMPTHWHLVLWPRGDNDLSEFMRWLTVTHTQRWHAHHHSSGTGPVYQGRFKSFPIQRDEHLLAVLRYVERNPLRAKLVRRAENWQWGSLWLWVNRQSPDAHGPEVPAISNWPIERPRNWAKLVNAAVTRSELEAVQHSVKRGAPFGGTTWVKRTAKRLDLEPTLRPVGRPRLHSKDRSR